MTNADRIRSMSDEKMAADRVKCKRFSNMTVWFGDFFGWAHTKEAAIERELAWLRSPVDEYISEDIKSSEYIEKDIEGDA